MKDVARLAGVSTSTVSHVINNNRFVSDGVRKKVNDAIAELNYAPSALARSLKMNRTNTIGMLVTTSNNPFYAEVVRGVERSCYELSLIHISEPTRQAEISYAVFCLKKKNTRKKKKKKLHFLYSINKLKK